MKMRIECYNAIKTAVVATVEKYGGIEKVDELYEDHTPKRQRWDLFWASRAMSDVDFDLLHDSHIDTALRRIMKELRNG